MLSDRFICPHCGHEKTNKEQILSIEVLAGYKLHFFCIMCGQGFQVSVQDGQYLIEGIIVED